MSSPGSAPARAAGPCRPARCTAVAEAAAEHGWMRPACSCRHAGARSAVVEAAEAGVAGSSAWPSTSQHDVMTISPSPATAGRRSRTQHRGSGGAGARPASASCRASPTTSSGPGRIGVISRSGSLGTLVSHEPRTAGLGQSAFIGIGGDPMLGTTTPTPSAPGRASRHGADRARRRDRRRDGGGGGGVIAATGQPAAAFIAGRSAPPARRMGHAGAIVTGGRGSGSPRCPRSAPQASPWSTCPASSARRSSRLGLHPLVQA